MRKLEALFVSLLGVAALFCFATPGVADDGPWYKFCVDVYVIAKPGDAANPDPSVSTPQAEASGIQSLKYVERRSPVPRSKFKDGVATFGPNEPLPDQNIIGPTLARMFPEINTTAKDCKLWFQGARIHFVDPSQASVGGHKLSEWLTGKNAQGMPAYDPAAKVDKKGFLQAFEEFTKSVSPKSNCLSMILVPFKGTQAEAGFAVVGGDHSIVDLNEVLNPYYGGFTPMHELLHNMGLGEHNSEELVTPTPGAGRIDVLAKGKDIRNEVQKIHPFINEEDCKKLRAFVGDRYHGRKFIGSVKPVPENPPDGYLTMPKEPEPPPECPAPASAEGANKPQRPAAGDLPVPTSATTPQQFAEMEKAWREALPALPKDCCGARTVEDSVKYVREMLKRIEEARESTTAEYHKALGENGDKATGARLQDLRAAIDALKKALIERRDALMKAQKGRKAGKDCDHTVSFLPGEPLFPSDGYERSYAMKFAYSVPELCVATTYYVGTRVTHEGDEPLIDLAEPISLPQVPVADGGPDAALPDCPRMAAAPVAPIALQEQFTSSEPAATPPPEEELPKTTEVDEPPPPEAPPPTAETDLGLVKAKESVVKLVFEGAPTGEAVSQGVVKLLDPVPEIPRDAARDPVLTSEENYTAGSEGGQLDDGGAISVSLDEETKPHIVPKTDENAIPPAKAILTAPDTAYAQVTLVGKPNAERTVPALPRSLVPAGTHICVNRSFHVGDRPVYVVTLPKDLVDRFTKNVNESGYSFAEPDPCRQKEEVNDPLFNGKGLWGQDFDDQWALKRIGFDGKRVPGWPPAPGTLEPVTVAVIDTGLDWYHPDFSPDTLWRNTAETPGNGIDDDGDGYIDDDIGWNLVDGNRLPWDDDGHGTFTAGVIGATVNNGVGIAGIDPAARIMVLKALDAFGRGHASMVAEAISYAADHGASVINLSLGGPGLTRVEQLAVDYAQSKGALVVVAAGNAAQEVSGYAPAGLAGVITVAATDRADRRAGFSNWGPLVDIAAPGVDVLSLRARNTDLLSLIPGVKYEAGKGIVGSDHAYFRASGTSFAAPLVTGTIALLRSHRPDLDAASVKRMVLQSARDIETPGIDNYTGYGLLDASAALAADPSHFVEARINGVEVIRKNGKPALRLTGTADANAFRQATIMIGQGGNPSKWLRIDQPITAPVSDGTLIDLPAALFAKSKDWTLRLVTEHKDGTKRESRFHLVLG